MNDDDRRADDAPAALRGAVRNQRWLPAAPACGEAGWLETEMRIAAGRQAYREIKRAVTGRTRARRALVAPIGRRARRLLRFAGFRQRPSTSAGRT